jgi:predicted CopG family antitoxin
VGLVTAVWAGKSAVGVPALESASFVNLPRVGCLYIGNILLILVSILRDANRSYKSILVNREVYEKLRSLKKSNESFSDLIDSLVSHSAADLGPEKIAGVLADDDDALKLFEGAMKVASKHFRWSR